MNSLKRKSPHTTLQKRVRARRESSEELELNRPDPRFNNGGNIAPHDNEDSDSEEESESESEPEASKTANAAASISFGALARAQSSIPQAGEKRKPKVQGDGWENNEEVERKAGYKDHRDFNRSSKHAPTEISSKKAVPRRREVVPIAKRQHRDPRFEPLSGEVQEFRVKAAYSFLDDYREDEMKELQTAIKTTKDADAKEKLKRALMSMESRKKAQARKNKEQEVLDRHRKEEKELVKQGKEPFYLKKSEQKKRLLLAQYGELKGKQLDHVIERRRKKVEGKEKKKLPYARRSTDA